MDYEHVPKRAMGERIRSLRTERGWRQEDLATRAGVGRRHLGLVETGRSGLSTANLFAVADALGADARWLWHGDEDATEATA